MASSNTSGSFVPTTNIWDVSDINSLKETEPELKELLVRLYQNLNRISLALNTKDSGFYVTNEFVTGSIYFPNPTLSSATSQTPAMRQTFRLVVNFGALPNTTTKSVPHNLTPNTSWTFTSIYGCASNTTSFDYIPLPYSSNNAGDEIELSVSPTNVVITTAADYSAYNITYVILEYLKN